MSNSAIPEQMEAQENRVGLIDEQALQMRFRERLRVPSLLQNAVRAHAKRLLKAGIFAAVGLGVYSHITAPPVVNVVEVKAVSASQTLGATGKVRGERVADLGLDTTGVVKRIYVRSGDTVQAGQLIMSLDKSENDESVAGARAAVNSALADLSKASKGPLASEINRARAELAQASLVGQARVDQAEARLRSLQAGSRPQEIAAARADLQSRRDLLAKAQKDLQRTEKLVNQGALAKSNLDAAHTDVETARSAVNAQQQRVNLLEAGARQEDLAEARAAVAEAKATRDTSIRASREALNTLLATPRSEDIAAARARVDEASAELRRSQKSMAKSDLSAPFTGVVADIAVEEGQSVSPGEKLVTFHEISRPVIEVETDEDNLNDLTQGQTATVTSDAYPGKSFQASLVDLGSNVNADRGTITIKLRPIESVTWLRPDLTVDVNITIRRAAQSIMVPPDALARIDGQTAVLVVRDGRATPVSVTTGASGADGVVVEGKLADGDLVVRNASQVKPRGVVRIDREA